MNILLTGATGFIGSHLVKKLLATPVDNVFILARKGGDFTANIIVADMAVEGFVDKLPGNIDCVIHLAQSEHYRNFPEKAQEIFQINVQSTLSLLEWGRQTNIKKFIYFSSGNVYKPADKLLREDDLLGAFSFYGSTKIMAEELCKSFSGFFEVDILRPFGVYGPGQTGMFIQNLIHRLKQNEAITLASGIGMQTTPLYIDDCTEIVMRLVKRPARNGYSTYNLCGGESLSIKDMSEVLARLMGREPQFTYNEKTPLYLSGDNSKVCKDLDFSPAIDFKTGAQNLIN